MIEVTRVSRKMIMSRLPTSTRKPLFILIIHFQIQMKKINDLIFYLNNVIIIWPSVNTFRKTMMIVSSIATK